MQRAINGLIEKELIQKINQFEPESKEPSSNLYKLLGMDSQTIPIDRETIQVWSESPVGIDCVTNELDSLNYTQLNYKVPSLSEDPKAYISYWKAVCKKAGMPRQRYSEVLRVLLDKKAVHIETPYILLGKMSGLVKVSGSGCITYTPDKPDTTKQTQPDKPDTNRTRNGQKPDTTINNEIMKRGFTGYKKAESELVEELEIF